MTEVTLPSGGSATLKEVKDLKAGDKLAVQGALTIDMSGGEMQMNLAMLEEIKVSTIARVVLAWSFEAAPSVESVQDLSLADYAALCDATAEHNAALGLGADKS